MIAIQDASDWNCTPKYPLLWWKKTRNEIIHNPSAAALVEIHRCFPRVDMMDRRKGILPPYPGDIYSASWFLWICNWISEHPYCLVHKFCLELPDLGWKAKRQLFLLGVKPLIDIFLFRLQHQVVKPQVVCKLVVWYPTCVTGVCPELRDTRCWLFEWRKWW